MRHGRQDHVVGLNARELFEDGAPRISETGAALPHLQRLPQHEGEKTDEDVCLHAILALMSDRTDVELIFLDAERGFGLGELDVGLPELRDAVGTRYRGCAISSGRRYTPWSA